MDDLISRQAAIDAILDDKIGEESLAIMKALGSENEAKTLNMACDRHVKFIKKIPSAQPERKKGKWINVFVDGLGYNGLEFECSECGKRSAGRTNFCAYCGAQMKSE